MRGRPRGRWVVAAGILIALFVWAHLARGPAYHDLPLDYTSHALMRMHERGVSSEEVERVVRLGRWEPGNRPGRYEAALAAPAAGRDLRGPVRVVVALEPDRLVVITVMRASP